MITREPRYFLEVNSAKFPCHLGHALWWHEGSGDRKALNEIDVGDVVYHYVGSKVNSDFLKKICEGRDCHRSMVIMRSKVKRVVRGQDGSGFDANDLKLKLRYVLGDDLGRSPCAGMDLGGISSSTTSYLKTRAGATSWRSWRTRGLSCGSYTI